MVLVIDDMVAITSLGRYRCRHWMLFRYSWGRVSRGTTFSAFGGWGGRLGRRLTALRVSIRVSM